MALSEGNTITFYGHFSGESSFPVVSRAVAKWMIKRGYAAKIVNLRTDKVEPGRVPGVGLLFGFPSWYEDIPRHEHMFGYHVPDVSSPPPLWGKQIADGCDHVLTPSRWCKSLLSNLGLRQKITVVRHGIDADVFYPAGGRSRSIVLRHYCSSESMERKGTIELLRAATMLLSHRFSAGSVVFRVSVPAQAFPRVVGFAHEFPGGRIEVIEDVPRMPEDFADELRLVSAVVQPSRAEGFGLIPLQAVACGTPVVLTETTGHAEYIDDIKDVAEVVRSGIMESCSGGRAPSIIQTSLVNALIQTINVASNRERLVGVSEEVRRRWSWDVVLDQDLAPVLDLIMSR